MRFVALLLAVSPSFVFADTIVARIMPTDVTVFTQGAEVTRKGKIAIPAGVHDIVFPDLRPNSNKLKSPTVALSGATVISQKWQNKTANRLEEPTTEAYKAAKSELETAQKALTAMKDEITAQSQVQTAAQSQIEFLKTLASSKTLPSEADSLRALSKMIMDETLNARKAIQQAEIASRSLQKDLPDLQDAVAKAKKAVEALLPPSNAFAQLTVTVTVPEATTSNITVKYLTPDAGWKPVYDMHLLTSDAPKLILKRDAMLGQNTGERWEGVNLTLSTVQPNERPDASPLSPWQLRISGRDPYAKRALSSGKNSALDSLMMEEPILEEAKMANADLTGISAEYHFEHPMSVHSDYDFSRVALGSLEFDAEIKAQAIALNEQTAFRIVSFTNSSGERLLPAQADLYIDGRLTAETYIPQIVPNAETDVGFGPIHGLRLTRTILNRNKGDRGIITRSNETTETARIDIENLTTKDWTVTLLDRVPFTEQEDLSIAWSASPPPDSTDYEDQRGILHWDLDVKSGVTQSITLETKTTWPDGMFLR